MYRYIECSIWSNKEMEDFNPEEKLLWIYLFTNQATDSCGIYQISMRRMAFDTGIKIERVAEILEKFEQAKPPMAIFDGNEVVIPGFIKHQANRSPKILFHIARQLEKAKNKEFVELVLKRNDTVSIPYKYPIDTQFIDKDKGKDKDKDKKRKGKDCIDEKSQPLIISKDEMTQLIKTNDASVPFKSKSEKIDALVELITEGLYPVGSKDKLERAMKTYGFEKMVSAIERCKEYYRFVKEKKLKRYVFAKRFSKFIENLATFTDEDAFRERLRLMEKWGNEPEGKIDAHKQWLMVGSQREEIPTEEPKEKLTDHEMLIKMMNQTWKQKTSYENLLKDKKQCKQFPEKIKKWESELHKLTIEYENIMKKIEAMEKEEKTEEKESNV